MAAKKLACMALIALSVLATSCGSGSSNDQGTSFLAINYTFLEGDVATGCSVSDSVFLSTIDVAVNADSGSISCFQTSSPFQLRAGFQVTNLLSTQFIRLQSTQCDYTVLQQPGFFIPPTVSAFSGVLDDTQNTRGDAVPEVLSAATVIMNEDSFQYINSRLSQLPELPITISADCRATGVTSAGNVLTSNAIPLNITLVDFPEFFDSAVPTPNQTGSTGTGGEASNTTTNSTDAGTDNSTSSIEPTNGLIN